jgi:glycosyltransferase involved in cell wall biosynthesis
MFEKNPGKMDARLEYYYGKELFEAQKPLEAFSQLLKASKEPSLEIHDRILCIQYCAMAAMLCNQYDTAINVAYQGLQLSPHRAELYSIIGDCYLRKQQLDYAIPSFVAAANCSNSTPNTATFQTALFTQADAYGHYPRNQLARIHFHGGRINEAKKWLEQALLLGPNVETGALYAEVLKQEKLLLVPAKGSVPKVDEYVISSPMQTPYVWDENIAKTRGIGGSETAVVQMARHLHNLTGKVVRIFHERPDKLELDGVIYEPNGNTKAYFSSGEPIAHIAWRHNVKVTNAPTFLWCHDLMAPGIDAIDGYDKVLCLSEFHKNYLRHVFNVPEGKICLTRNGIDLDRFTNHDFSDKNPNKIVFSSSPDRGLDRAVAVVAKARELSNRDLELHTFYGFDNMLKLGLSKQVADMQAMLAQYPWVKLHGNVQQNELVKHLASAKAWLYPTDFLETYCITALEMLACRVRPVVRAWGALPHTLKDMPCALVDSDCSNNAEVELWAKELLMALDVNQPVVDMEPFSWKSVAREWCSWLPK